MIHYKLVLRPILNNENLFNVALRITENRKAVFLFIPIKTSKRFWNETKQELKGKDERNLILKGYKNRVEKIIFDAEVSGTYLTAKDVKDRLTQKESLTFNDFIENEIMSMKFADQTIKNYKSQLRFINSYNSNIQFKNIDLNFIEKYYNYINDRGLKDNTVTKNITIFRTFVNRARKKGYIKNNPFEHFKIKGYKNTREYLSEEELEAIEQLQGKLKHGLKNVVEHFLFSCYTGLRYQDLKDLKHSNISNNIIQIEMHKTRQKVTIPLIDKAQVLIKNKSIDNEYVFNIFSNQVTNRHLKEIRLLSGIKKPISFHIARHTFATLALTYGIPLDVVSQLLGHQNTKVTQIYAKIIDQVKVDYMKKLNNR